MGPPAAEIAADVRSFLAELERDDTLVPSASNGSLPSPTANRLSLSRAAYSHGALLGGNDPQKLRKADMKRIENLARPRRGPGSAHYTPGEVKPLVKGRHGPSKAWLEQRAQPRKTRTRDDNDYEPAIYLHDRGAWSQPCGGKFNESRPKSWIDWNIYLSRSIPGPATYAPHLAPNLPKVSYPISFVNIENPNQAFTNLITLWIVSLLPWDRTARVANSMLQEHHLHSTWPLCVHEIYLDQSLPQAKSHLH